VQPICADLSSLAFPKKVSKILKSPNCLPSTWRSPSKWLIWRRPGTLRCSWNGPELITFRIDFGVGTPDRLAALLEEKALSTANLKQVVIDVSYIDQKKRGILDMKELHESLIKFLLRKNFVGEGKERGDDLFVFY
jgi:hypothetical protein